MPYNISFIASTKKIFSIDVIENSMLEKEGLKIHKYYGADEESFYSYEYNYRSSVSSAIHNKAKTHCLDEETLKVRKGEIEHIRWNAYVRSVGYIYSSTRNDLGKMHPDLIPYDELKEKERQKDDTVTKGVITADSQA